MTTIRELDVVRVVSIEGTQYSLEEQCERAPQIGDLATVMALLHASKHPDGYMCECVGGDGRTLWLATFLREALEPVEAHA
jgi:hypothetical protein